jgi:hypothetical protein
MDIDFNFGAFKRLPPVNGEFVFGMPISLAMSIPGNLPVLMPQSTRDVELSIPSALWNDREIAVILAGARVIHLNFSFQNSSDDGGCLIDGPLVPRILSSPIKIP